MKTLAFLTLSLLSLPAFADGGADHDAPPSRGGSDRGGGNAIVCFANPAIPKAIRIPGNPSFGVITSAALASITKVEMLDVYQAKLPKNEKPSPFDDRLGAPLKGETPDNFANRLLYRIANYAPGVFKKIEEGKRALQGNISYSNQGVAPIDDVNLLFSFDRDHCVIATIAAQDAQNDQLFVDIRLYNHPKHSVTSKAAMWLHEWTYYSLLHKGVNTSAGVRGILGRMLIAGSNQTVKDLTSAAVKAGLISAGTDSLNGVELQAQKKFTELKASITWSTNFNWYTGECPETLCSTFWMFRSEFEEKLYQFNGVSCYTLDGCEDSLKKFIGETTDPGLKHQAENLLSDTQNYRGKLQIGKDVLKFLPIKLAGGLSENPSDYPQLPEYELKDATEFLTWAVNAVAIHVDTQAINSVPIRRYSNFDDYQKNMRQLRDQILDEVTGFSTTTNIQSPYLMLPYLSD